VFEVEPSSRSSTPDGCRPIVAKPDLHVGVFPLHTEVHRVLDIDNDRIAIRRHPDVVQAQLTVHGGVFGARAYRRRELAQPILESFAGIADSAVTPGCLSEGWAAPLFRQDRERSWMRGGCRVQCSVM
jgi:hypothetical protein